MVALSLYELFSAVSQLSFVAPTSRKGFIIGDGLVVTLVGATFHFRLLSCLFW